MAARRLIAAGALVGALVGTSLVVVPRAVAAEPAEGDVLAFGDAVVVAGSAGEDVVDAASTPTGAGWWAVSAAGRVTPGGDATDHGDLAGRAVNAPFVGIAAPPSRPPSSSGDGYWLVAADGGVFAFGAATFHGSTGAMDLNEPIVAMASTPSGGGYWLVASDGGVFTFGDAAFAGSAAGALAAPVTDAAAAPAGGYWLLAADGTVAAYGGAFDAGSATIRDGAAVGLAPTASGLCYRVVVGRVRDVVTIWQPGGLRGDSQAWAQGVAGSSGARSVLRHRANLDLDAGNGWRIPMSLTTYEPGPARPLVGPAAAAALGRGEAVLGTEAAALRHAAVGSILTFVGWDGRHRRRVGAIVPDERIGWAEVALATADAASMGVNRAFAVEVWGAPRASIDRALAAAPAKQHALGVQRSWTPVSPDETLANARLKPIVGEVAYRHGSGDSVALEPSWVSANIMSERLPGLGTVTCHRAAMPALRGALTEVVRAGVAGGLGRFGGCYNARLIRGGDSGGFLSRHSFGIAIDVNTSRNTFGGRVDMDPRIVDIFRRWGFAWGGTWVRPDGMHFEYAPS